MKKILTLALTLVMALTISFSYQSTVSAACPNDDAYRAILDSINEEYDLELGYCSVDPTVVSLSEYEETVRAVAVEQKEINDYIANRENLDLPIVSTYASTTTTKTVSKDVLNNETLFQINATYDVNGVYVSNPRDISISRKLGAILNEITYTPFPDYPTIAYLDSHRTFSVTYYGVKVIGSTPINNVKFYAEFTYDS